MEMIYFLQQSRQDGEPYVWFSNDECSTEKSAVIRFENDLYDMIQNIEFKKVKNDFQTKMLKGIKSVRTNGKIYAKAECCLTT